MTASYACLLSRDWRMHVVRLLRRLLAAGSITPEFSFLSLVTLLEDKVLWPDQNGRQDAAFFLFSYMFCVCAVCEFWEKETLSFVTFVQKTLYLIECFIQFLQGMKSVTKSVQKYFRNTVRVKIWVL